MYGQTSKVMERIFFRPKRVFMQSTKPLNTACLENWEVGKYLKNKNKNHYFSNFYFYFDGIKLVVQVCILRKLSP